MSLDFSLAASGLNNTDYVSVDSDGDMVELCTAGTAPPSTISCATDLDCGFTFVTADNNLGMPNSVSTDATFITAFEHPTFLTGFYPGPNSLPDSIRSVPDVDIAQISAVDPFPDSTLSQQQSEVVVNKPNSIVDSHDVAQDASPSSIRSLIARMENSVGAILDGINTLTANDNPKPACRRSSRNHKHVKMAPLTGQIRQELKKLLGEGFMDDSQIVSREALKTFADLWAAEADITLKPACCNIEDFRVDLLGSPRSPWNQSAARVFYAHFIQTNSVPEDHLHLIHHFFYQRMKGLQSAYRKERANIAATKAAAAAKRRHARRQSLFTKRVDIATQHPLLRDHLNILHKLGPAGMSSDESDFEGSVTGQATRYLVHKQAWRGESLTPWLRVFDTLHVLSRRLSATGTRGSFPCLRVESEIASGRAFVAELPVTAYDAKWLENHTAAQLHVRHIAEEYSFTHHNQIFAYMRYRNM